MPSRRVTQLQLRHYYESRWPLVKVEVELQHATNSHDPSLNQTEVFYEVNELTRIVDGIAATRNIAATWDIVRCTVDGKDCTKSVADVYYARYGCRRHLYL